ncbi:MAG TPA: metal-sulfur cluster assembly factor [Albitalea sp.]
MNIPPDVPPPEQPYPYEGPPELAQPVLAALTRVVDPEVAMSIVDVGLVYGVRIADGVAHVRVTMTSAACPVTDVIMDEVQQELECTLPADVAVDVELTWFPPWTPDRMSERARDFMGW